MPTAVELCPCAFRQVPIHTVTLDVRDLDSIAALPSQLPAEFAEVSRRIALATGELHMLEHACKAPPDPCDCAQVDILVNNAGLALGVASVTEITREVSHPAFHLQLRRHTWRPCIWMTAAGFTEPFRRK